MRFRTSRSARRAFASAARCARRSARRASRSARWSATRRAIVLEIDQALLQPLALFGLPAILLEPQHQRAVVLVGLAMRGPQGAAHVRERRLGRLGLRAQGAGGRLNRRGERLDAGMRAPEEPTVRPPLVRPLHRAPQPAQHVQRDRVDRVLRRARLAG